MISAALKTMIRDMLCCIKLKLSLLPAEEEGFLLEDRNMQQQVRDLGDQTVASVCVKVSHTVVCLCVTQPNVSKTSLGMFSTLIQTSSFFIWNYFHTSIHEVGDIQSKPI